jgi:hypothetical protein
VLNMKVQTESQMQLYPSVVEDTAIQYSYNM